MVLSVECSPGFATFTDVYTPYHVKDMRQIIEQPPALNIRTVFVMDGYVAHKQTNFTVLMKDLMLLERVSVLLRIAPDKEDKVVVKDLNDTLHGLGGRSHCFLDVSERLRRIVLHRPGVNSYSNTENASPNPFFPSNASQKAECEECRPIIIRKYIRCKGVRSGVDRGIWGVILVEIFLRMIECEYFSMV